MLKKKERTRSVGGEEGEEFVDNVHSSELWHGQRRRKAEDV